MEEPERRLRMLAEGGSGRTAPARVATLDAKTDALVRIAALVAINAVPSSYLCAIRNARTVGASVDEVIDTLVAVSTTVGMARVVAATPGVAEALGIDIDAALEAPDPELRVAARGRQPASPSGKSDSRRKELDKLHE